jgi:hypothetical protein
MLRVSTTLQRGNIPAHDRLMRQIRNTPSTAGLRAPHLARHWHAHRKHATEKHPDTHAATAPHSRQSCEAVQCRRDTAGKRVVVQVQGTAGHTDSDRVTPWHSTMLWHRNPPVSNHTFPLTPSQKSNQSVQYLVNLDKSALKPSPCA